MSKSYRTIPTPPLPPFFMLIREHFIVAYIVHDSRCYQIEAAVFLIVALIIYYRIIRMDISSRRLAFYHEIALYTKALFAVVCLGDCLQFPTNYYEKLLRHWKLWNKSFYYNIWCGRRRNYFFVHKAAKSALTSFIALVLGRKT